MARIKLYPQAIKEVEEASVSLILNEGSVYIEAKSKENIRHNRSGNLRDSIYSVIDLTDQVAYIGSDLDYSYYLEMGTVKMEPRPYLRPALDEYVATLG